MTESPSPPRQPWVAVVLSLLCTGLGQIYCGRLVRGLVLFLLFLLFAPAVVGLALLGQATPVLVALLLLVALVLGNILFSVVDAYRVARAGGDSLCIAPQGLSMVYVLFILVGVTYPPGVVGVLRANVFEAFYIPTASEVPNFLPGDRILVNKLIQHGDLPRRGEVVVFHNPQDRRQNFIKRVIGLPGDRVEVKSGRVILNGKQLEWEPVPLAALSSVRDAVEGGKVFTEVNSGVRYLVLLGPEKNTDLPEQRVPEGSIFVLGDNRNRSLDSREFGSVPLGDVVGLVQYIYYPAESWSRFGAYSIR